jgi:hypothetical protein
MNHTSRIRRCVVMLAMLPLINGLQSCSRSDPQAALEAAVQLLQDNLEAKKASAVLDQLDVPFRAQQELDRDWAKRTLTLMFLQHRNVHIVAVSRSSRIAEQARDIGYTDAKVLLTGAQGLIPDQASPYGVASSGNRSSSIGSRRSAARPLRFGCG